MKQTKASKNWRVWANRILDRWLSRRLPPQHQVVLNHRRLFILPTKSGLAFLLVIGLIWLLGTNYQNNLAILLAFWLLALFVVAIFFTYANLSGICLTKHKNDNVFAGDDAPVEVGFAASGKRTRFGLMAFWVKHQAVQFHLVSQQTESILLYVPTQKRGKQRLGRLCIETRYPLGLLRCWSWVDLDIELLVYPRPKSVGPLPPPIAQGKESDQLPQWGTDDFWGFKPYQSGDSLKHIGWKQLARGQGLLTKQFRAFSDVTLWLDWDYLAGIPTEFRLSALAAWLLKADASGVEYGMRLPSSEWPVNRGKHHLHQLLSALALFPVSGNEAQADSKRRPSPIASHKAS